MSATKNNRARSATPDHHRTPQSANRQINFIPLTCEKKKAPVDDKNWLSENVNAITNFLKNNKIPNLSKDFLQRGGLKSMSTKNFVDIVIYFMKIIGVCNKDLESKMSNNHVDCISNFLNQYEYPYSINKSWLKTPNIPNAYNNVIVLLSWLLQFVPNQESIDEFEKDFLLPMEGFKNADFTKIFNQGVKEGFVAWNADKEFEDDIKSKMIDQFISNSDIEFNDLKTLKAKTSEKMKELKMLFKNRIILEGEDELKQKETSLKKIDKKLSSMTESAERKSKELTTMTSHLSLIEKKLNEKNLEKINLEKSLKTQRINVDEKILILKEICQQNCNIKTQVNLIIKIQDESATEQINLARKLNEMIELLSNLNHFVHKLAEMKKIDPEEFKISINDPEDEKMKKYKEIKKLIETVSNETDLKLKKLVTEIDNFQHELKHLTTDYEMMSEKSAKLHLKCEQLTNLISLFDDKIVNTKKNGEKELEEAKLNFKKIEEELKENILMKIATKERFDCIVNENLKLEEKILKHVEKLEAEELEEIEQQEKLLDELNNVLIELEAEILKN